MRKVRFLSDVFRNSQQGHNPNTPLVQCISQNLLALLKHCNNASTPWIGTQMRGSLTPTQLEDIFSN